MWSFLCLQLYLLGVPLVEVPLHRPGHVLHVEALAADGHSRELYLSHRQLRVLKPGQYPKYLLFQSEI